MRIKELKVYRFDELSDEAKEKAIEKISYINVDHDWWNYVYEDAKQVGLKIKGFDIDRGSYVEGEFICAANEVAQNILNNHRDSCETYKTAKAFLEEWEPIFSSYMDETSKDYESRESEEKLLELEDEFLKDLCEDYRIMLQHDYEYLTSEEAIKETIEANDYEFDEYGNLA